jgi:hypothetical protein
MPYPCIQVRIGFVTRPEGCAAGCDTGTAARADRTRDTPGACQLGIQDGAER